MQDKTYLDHPVNKTLHDHVNIVKILHDNFCKITPGGFDTGFFARGGGGGTILLIAYSGFSIVYIFFVGREEGKHTDCMYIIHEYLKPLRNMT